MSAAFFIFFFFFFFFLRGFSAYPRSDTTRNNTFARYLEIAKDPCVRQTVESRLVRSDSRAKRESPHPELTFVARLFVLQFSLFLPALLSQLTAFSSRARRGNARPLITRLEINRQYVFA